MPSVTNIKSISYLKSHAAQISEDLQLNGNPYFITQNGDASMVIEGVKAYQEKESLIAALKIMALGEKDRVQGKGLTAAQSRAQLLAARLQGVSRQGLGAVVPGGLRGGFGPGGRRLGGGCLGLLPRRFWLGRAGPQGAASAGSGAKPLKRPRRRWISSNEMAAGVTPEMREAWPRVSGL